MNVLTVPFERKITRDPSPVAWAGAPLLVLTACDSAYVGHAIALARSMDAFSGAHHLMIHVVNPDEGDIARLELLANSMQSVTLHISTEQVELPVAASSRAYYASARFIRMAELLGGGEPVPLLALDADALAVGPLTLDFSDKPEAEICLRRRDLKGPVEDHLRIAAGAVWVRNTPRVQKFMDGVASDLLAEFASGKGEWFVDQLVLLKHVLAETGDAQVRNLKSKFSDWSMLDDAVFWTGKGDRKYLDVRYLLLREAFDEDATRRDTARLLHARLNSRIPAERQGDVGRKLRQSLAHSRRPRVAIFLPRLDLPWKQSGMRVDGRAPIPSADTVELRLWWKQFAMELARTLTDRGVTPVLVEIPAWEITPERIDGEDVDLAFVPHRCELDFGPTQTVRRFYMQEYFRHVFVLDRNGWSAASSVYPVDANALSPAVLGAWDHYCEAFRNGTLRSKFAQEKPSSRLDLRARGEIPSSPFIFYPLQVPHDQSIRYFSDVDQNRALELVHDLAVRTGLSLVLKEHPANRASMKTYRERYRAPFITWSEAHIHDLLRHASGVVTINSGVGFEALLAGKPIVCLGRAEYDTSVHRAGPDDLYEAWNAAISEPDDVRLRRYGRFVDWFLGRHAVDLTRPYAGRYVLDRLVQEALAEATRDRGNE